VKAIAGEMRFRRSPGKSPVRPGRLDEIAITAVGGEDVAVGGDRRTERVN